MILHPTSNPLRPSMLACPLPYSIPPWPLPNNSVTAGDMDARVGLDWCILHLPHSARAVYQSLTYHCPLCFFCFHTLEWQGQEREKRSHWLYSVHCFTIPVLYYTHTRILHPNTGARLIQTQVSVCLAMVLRSAGTTPARKLSVLFSMLQGYLHTYSTYRAIRS